MESLASLGDVLVSFLATVVVCMGSCAQESQASLSSQGAFIIDTRLREGLPGYSLLLQSHGWWDSRCSLTSCETHYVNSNPNGIAGAGITPTSKFCKN